MRVLQPASHRKQRSPRRAPAPVPVETPDWGRYGPVPRATAMAGWALLPLRAFLGFTFTFAGLQKLANPGFFQASNPASIQSQLAAAARRSPIHSLVAHLVHAAVPLGVVIALGEVAIGVATLVGLWSRAAAVGGLLLSFSLFLTVSYHSSPYYTGSDIVFVFAWMPLILAGAGGVLSVDALARDLARRRHGAEPATVVPVPFEAVRQICGAYESGACRAMGGAPCRPAPCPYLATSPAAPARAEGDIDRRTFTLQGIMAGAVAGVALLGAGLAAGIGRALGGSSGTSSAPTLSPGTTTAGPSTTTAGPSATTSAPGASSTSGSSPDTTVASKPAGTAIGAASVVPVGGSASFQDPTSGDPSLVVQPKAGTFVAFDAVCPHAGCIVAYSGSAEKFICPCHGSQFNGRTGAVEQGPAETGLGRIAITKGPDGQLYVT
jgi:thiosulfate dehydrogenase [quinone] large subunit